MQTIMQAREKDNGKVWMMKENLFLFTLTLWFLWEQLMMSTSIWTSVGESIILIVYVCGELLFIALFSGIILFQRKYSRKEIIILVIATILFAIASYNHSFNIISFWLIIVAAKGEKLDRIIRYGYIALLAFVGTVILLYFLGIIGENSDGYRETLRHSLGFGHPNYLGMDVLALMAYRFYLHRDHWNIWDYLLSILEIAFVYFVPNSLGAVVGMLLMFAFSLLWKLAKKWKRVENVYLWLLVAFCLFCNLFCVITSLLYTWDSAILNALNQLFSTRLECANIIYQHHGIKLFGSNILMGNSYYSYDGQTTEPYLDASYMRLLLNYGIVSYLIHSFLYLGTANFARKRNPVLLIMMAVFAAHGLMEGTLVEVFHNLFLLGISLFLFSEDGPFQKSGEKESTPFQYLMLALSKLRLQFSKQTEYSGNQVK